MWRNFVTSGTAIGPAHADYRKLYLTNTLLLTAVVVFAVFALMTCCVSGQFVIALVDLAGALAAGGTILYLRRTGRLFQSSAILVGMVSVLTLLSIYMDTFPNMNLAWIYALFLLERQIGLWVVLVYTIVYAVILWSKFDSVEAVNKGPVLIANLFGVLIVVTVLTRYFEVSRKEAQAHLELGLRELTVYRGRLEQQLAEGMSQLELKDKMLLQHAKMASMGEMIAIIAHQLKQPLNMIALVTQDAKESYRSGELDAARIEQLESVRFMTGTIDAFKNFLDPNKRKRIFSLRESIDKSLEIVSPRFRLDDIHTVIEGEDALLHGVASEMQQVVMNLLINARDAIVQHKITDRVIGIEVKDQGTFVVFAVRDRAGGIPAEIGETLFDSFVSSKGDEGMGLGLYMVKMIVEGYGGTVEVENRDGGACFTITLPKALPSA